METSFTTYAYLTDQLSNPWGTKQCAETHSGVSWHLRHSPLQAACLFNLPEVWKAGRTEILFMSFIFQGWFFFFFICFGFFLI